MKTRILMTVVLITLVMFFVSQIDYSKAINSSYFLLGEVEKQNMEEIISSIRYHTPSFTGVYNVINGKPYTNEDGDKEIFVGDFIENGVITRDNETLTNNFMYVLDVEYNNTSKDIRVYGTNFKDLNPEFIEYQMNNEDMDVVPFLKSPQGVRN